MVPSRPFPPCTPSLNVEGHVFKNLFIPLRSPAFLWFGGCLPPRIPPSPHVLRDRSTYGDSLPFPPHVPYSDTPKQFCAPSAQASRMFGSPHITLSIFFTYLRLFTRGLSFSLTQHSMFLRFSILCIRNFFLFQPIEIPFFPVF